MAFTDLSISAESISSWQWSFEGGTPATSNVQNPVINYENDDEYDVQLIVSNGILTDTLLKTNFIYVNLSPDPVISGSQYVISYSEEQYQTEIIPGNTYDWEVTGGNITSGGASYQVTVMWGDPGEGLLTVIEGSIEGCYSITNPYPVVVGDVSIEENFQGIVRIYPNLAQSTIIIELPTQPSNSPFFILTNINGQQLIAQLITAPQTEIEISQFPAGIYIVKVWNDKDLKVQKVIKK